MGTDTTYQEWYLTPRGWVSGPYSANFPLIQSTNTPADRVETWIEKNESHDVYPSRIRPEWELVWALNEYSDEERKRLREAMRNKPAPESDDPHRGFWNFPV